MTVPHHLLQIDLNLLLVLDELLRCHSTVVAAQRLGKTQSAVSHSLNRLRQVFNDPLFVRAGASLRPTNRALELEAPLRELVAGTEALFFQTGVFDPSRLKRIFAIGCADIGEIIVLPRLLPRLLSEAPGVEIRTMFYGDDVDRAIQAGEVDFAIGANFRELSSLISQRLFDERLICVARRGHPILAAPVTMDRFIEADHVLVAPRGRAGSFVDDALARRGLARRVVARIPHFTSALLIVAQSDLLVTLPRILASSLASHLPIQLFEPPLDLPSIRFSLVYSVARKQDPAHSWMRGLIRQAFKPEDEGHAAGAAL